MGIIKKIHSKLDRKWSYAASDMLGLMGMHEALFRNGRAEDESAGSTPRARILLYHGICRTHPTRFNSLFLRLKTFEGHLRFFLKYFHVLSLEDYYRKRFSQDRFNVCLTFDDGFANNYKYVLPLMNKYRVPAAFFLTGIRDAGHDILWNDLLAVFQLYGPREWSFGKERYRKDAHNRYISMDNNGSLRDLLQAAGTAEKEEWASSLAPFLPLVKKPQDSDYWLQMTPEEIRMLSDSPLATIGAHSYYHNDLSRISGPGAREEMLRGKQYLENITDKTINAFAFPYGNYSLDTITRAKSAGFTQLLATDFRFPENGSDPAMRERLTVNPYISINNQMKAIIHGSYDYE